MMMRALVLMESILMAGSVIVGASSPPSPRTFPFAMSDVRLEPTSLYAECQERNRMFLASLNVSRLLCDFTSAANFTHCVGDCPVQGDPGKPSCQRLNNEWFPGVPPLYGHFAGHWLSATAFLINNTGDANLRAMSLQVIDTLASCQKAWTSKYPDKEGYVFPYDPVIYDIMETHPGAQGPLYTVPFYSYHKFMAGLFDQWTMTGSETAGKVLYGMANWVAGNVQETLQRGGQDLWQDVLTVEWGGMNEVLFNLYALSGNRTHLETGYAFNHWVWTAPLAAGVDDLDDNHANTHIPEVIGNARGYEVTGNETDRDIVLEFFRAVTQNHSWATGGSNDGEWWGPPHRMGDQLSQGTRTEESCTQYNILKVARHLFQWSGDSQLADFYELALMNGIMGNQNKEDPHMTKFIYMLPMGGGGIQKDWGWSNEVYFCCWGTLAEQFAKLTDSVYFRSPDSDVLFVNLFISTQLQWAEKGVTIEQDAGFPWSTTSTTSIKVTKGSATFTLALRVPRWANGTNTVTLNGTPVSVPVVAGTYLRLEREWKDGDVLTAFFPMSLWSSRLNDDRPQFNQTMAFMYGPIVLAGLTTDVASTARFAPHGDAFHPSTFMTRNSSTALSFVAHGVQGTTMRMIPLFEIVDEQYGVYFDTRPSSVVPYSPSGGVVPTSSTDDYDFSGGAAGVPGHPDSLSTGTDVRSGNPGQSSVVQIDHLIEGHGHSLSGVSMAYRYCAGYTPPPHVNKIPTNFSLVLLDSMKGDVVARVYDSPPLGGHSCDAFQGYSEMIPVNVTGLTVPNDRPLVLAFHFHDNERNVQMPINDKAEGFDAKVHWN